MAFVRYNSELDRVVANLRFRYNPREGDDLHVVWNEGLDAARSDHDPVRPRSDERIRWAWARSTPSSAT